MLRAAALLRQRQPDAIARHRERERGGGAGSAWPASRDGGSARASQGSGSRAEPTARGDEAIRLRHGDPGDLPQTPIPRTTRIRGTPLRSGTPTPFIDISLFLPLLSINLLCWNFFTYQNFQSYAHLYIFW